MNKTIYALCALLLGTATLCSGVTVTSIRGCSGSPGKTVYVALDSNNKNDWIQSIIKGTGRACNANTNCCTKTIEPSANSDTTTVILSAIPANAHVIASGFMFTAPLDALTVSNGRSYANVDAAQTDGKQGVQGLVFAEQEAGFLAGIIAGGVANLHTKKVGAVGGLAIAPVMKFVAGMELGMKYLCPDCTMTAKYSPFGTGGFGNENNYGITHSKQLLDAGTGVIFGVGGLTGTLGIKFAALQPGTSYNITYLNTTKHSVTETITRPAQKAYVIGVDADEYITNFGGGSVVGAGMVITSAIKKNDRAACECQSPFFLRPIASTDPDTLPASCCRPRNRHLHQ